MKRTVETKFTKMLSVRVEKELYWQLKEELRRQANPKTRLGFAVSMTSLVSEMLEAQLKVRNGLRQLDSRM